MPSLANLRHEDFASLRACGISLEESYRRAGYAADRGHPSRLAARPDVIDRIEEIKRKRGSADAPDRSSAISALLHIGSVAMGLHDAAGFKEARLAIIEALRLFEEPLVAQPQAKRPGGNRARRKRSVA